ncbi:hypothetical protein HGRIS_010207 [Hohenbuehelia grisea]|uniref:Uncharacterized protein n=1 Tax=Hohenbuehelia grisea TaxID=104357 RepID=A0ABR3J3Z0_9AGAR
MLGFGAQVSSTPGKLLLDEARVSSSTLVTTIIQITTIMPSPPRTSALSSFVIVPASSESESGPSSASPSAPLSAVTESPIVLTKTFVTTFAVVITLDPEEDPNDDTPSFRPKTTSPGDPAPEPTLTNDSPMTLMPTISPANDATTLSPTGGAATTSERPGSSVSSPSLPKAKSTPSKTRLIVGAVLAVFGAILGLFAFFYRRHRHRHAARAQSSVIVPFLLSAPSTSTTLSQIDDPSQFPRDPEMKSVDTYGTMSQSSQARAQSSAEVSLVGSEHYRNAEAGNHGSPQRTVLMEARMATCEPGIGSMLVSGRPPSYTTQAQRNSSS